MTVAEVGTNTEITVAEIDHAEIAAFIRMVVSDPDLRTLFAVDAPAAIATSGVTLSPMASEALAKCAALGVGLTDGMDEIMSSYFFFYYKKG
ncbi:MAG: hypothetical protein ACR2KJ_16900 [Jatrophihabitans sp.]